MGGECSSSSLNLIWWRVVKKLKLQVQLYFESFNILIADVSSVSSLLDFPFDCTIMKQVCSKFFLPLVGHDTVAEYAASLQSCAVYKFCHFPTAIVPCSVIKWIAEKMAH